MSGTAPTGRRGYRVRSLGLTAGPRAEDRQDNRCRGDRNAGEPQPTFRLRGGGTAGASGSAGVGSASGSAGVASIGGGAPFPFCPLRRQVAIMLKDGGIHAWRNDDFKGLAGTSAA